MGHKRQRPATDPFSVRDNALHDKEYYTKYITSRAQKLRRLEDRGENENTDPRVMHLTDQIDDAENKRQKAVSDEEAMNAVIASGKIDPNCDYRREEEILADDEHECTSTSEPDDVTDYDPNSASDEVTDYDASDVENQTNVDRDDPDDTNDSDISYTTEPEDDDSSDHSSDYLSSD